MEVASDDNGLTKRNEVLHLFVRTPESENRELRLAEIFICANEPTSNSGERALMICKSLDSQLIFSSMSGAKYNQDGTLIALEKTMVKRGGKPGREGGEIA